MENKIPSFLTVFAEHFLNYVCFTNMVCILHTNHWVNWSQWAKMKIYTEFGRVRMDHYTNYTHYTITHALIYTSFFIIFNHSPRERRHRHWRSMKGKYQEFNINVKMYRIRFYFLCCFASSITLIWDLYLS